jgi:hypothetical protein
MFSDMTAGCRPASLGWLQTVLSPASCLQHVAATRAGYGGCFCDLLASRSFKNLRTSLTAGFRGSGGGSTLDNIDFWYESSKL